jgi:hypothetical protein
MRILIILIPDNPDKPILKVKQMIEPYCLSATLGRT